MKWFITSIVIVALANPAAAQTNTTFTYQGSLDDQGVPANGSFDFEFVLWDALSGGLLLSRTICIDQVVWTITE